MPCISIALLVLKLDRFNSFNDEHPENILSILVTFLVLKLNRFNSFNDEHPENKTTHISYIFPIKFIERY